jgi:Tfp pilus assembly protein PilN
MKKIATPPRLEIYLLDPKIRRKLRWARKRQQVKTVLDEISKIKEKQNDVVKRNMELFDTLTRNVDIYLPNTLPAKEWIDAFKQQAIEYRAYLLQITLHGMAVMEGARQASKNLTDDYGFAVTMDFTDIANIAKQVANIDLLAKLLSKTALTPAMRNKTLEFAAAASFGPDKHRNAMADMMRNLSIPEQSPFGASGLLRMSDPNMQSKMQQFTGKTPLQPALSAPDRQSMVKLSRGMDKISEDLRNERQARLHNR